MDLAKGTVRVRGTLSRIDGDLLMTEPKTAKPKRFVPISAPCERLLQGPAHRAGRGTLPGGSAWRQTGFAFTTESASLRPPERVPLKVAAAKSGLPDVGLHTLRHSAASVMLAHGVPLRVGSEIVGHSSIAIIDDV